MNQLEDYSENLTLTLGAGMITLMGLFALAADLFGIDRSHVRGLISIAFGIMSTSLVVRWLRLRYLGAQILVTRLPTRGWNTKRAVAWIWSAAFLGAYSTYEVSSGGPLLGLIGCLVSLAMVLVLVRGPHRK